jgi:hypothetical protein
VKRIFVVGFTLMLTTAVGVLCAAAAQKPRHATAAELQSLRTEAELAARNRLDAEAPAGEALLESAPAAAAGALLPGVGFDAFPGKPDPFPVGRTLPNDQLLAAYIGRYGVPPGSNPARTGFCCELFGVNETALHNAWAAGQIGDKQHDGQPTLREMTDASFVMRRIGFSKPGGKPGSNFYCQWWFAFTFPGGKPEAPLHVSRADRAAGAFTEVHDTWNCPVFYFNDGGGTAPPPPPPPPPVKPTDPPPTNPPPATGGTCYVVDAGLGAVITPKTATSIWVRPGVQSTGSMGRAIVAISEAPCP